MEERIKHLKFCQDFNSLGVGTEEGWSFLPMDNLGRSTDPFTLFKGGVRIIERMVNSNLAALVPISSPRKLSLLNIATNNVMLNLFFTNSIISVRLSRKKLIVLLENKIYLYDVRELKVLKEIPLPSPNSDGIIEIGANLLAYSIMEQSGIVEVYDTDKMEPKVKILAHASAVACIALSESGMFLATASEKGTLIRVFTTTQGTRAFEFRRGIMRNAAIQSMVFSGDGTFLAASSDTATIHVFKLHTQRDHEEVDNSWTGWFKASLAAIPQNSVTEKLFEERAFATISTNVEGMMTRKSVLGFRNFPFDNVQHMCVLVASYDGLFKIYSLNVQQGGECTLMKQHLFIQQSTSLSHAGLPSSSGAASPTSAISALTQSTLLPAMGNIPDLINQATVNINYGYGLIQSVLTDAANTLFEKTGNGVGGTAVGEQELEQEMPPGVFESNEG